MSIFREIVEGLRNLVQWWIIIAPWEQGVRVRLGKHVRILETGIHLRIPFIDRIYRQSIRLRYADTPTQTVTTLDGKTVTLSGTVGFCIKDILKLYQTLHHPQDTIANLAMSAASEYVATRTLDKCAPKEIERVVLEALHLEQYGLGDQRFAIIEFAVVRAYRLIQGQKWSMGDGLANLNEQRPGDAA